MTEDNSQAGSDLGNYLSEIYRLDNENLLDSLGICKGKKSSGGDLLMISPGAD